MRVAIASVAWLPVEFRDDERLQAELEARGARASAEPWDDPAVDWTAFDLVVIRSTWDYSRRREEFLAWADAVGERLRNPPALVRWNTHKRYLADLAAAGLPVVETVYVEPGQQQPPLTGEVVVKPAISAGGRDTGRFAPPAHEQAHELLAALAAAGRTAMVQPYLETVDRHGETAIVILDGEPSHALRKRPVLSGQGVAPVRDDPIGAAETMYDPDLVGPAEASARELELARAVVEEVRRRFGSTPLYARVDMVPGPGGEPVLIELEAVEPNLYFQHAPGAAGALAEAIIRLA